MNCETSERHSTFRREVRSFVKNEIGSEAAHWDQSGHIPREVIKKLGKKGYLTCPIPVQYGGLGLDQVCYGILNEEIGRESASLQSLLTVQCSLVASVIMRWGTEEQKEKWLPALASGDKIGAFAITEAEAGSDAKNIQSTYAEENRSFIIQGHKLWTSFGQIADVFVVAVRNRAEICTFLLERATAGLSVEPVTGMLGMRASLLAHLRMNGCQIPASALLGRKGFGFIQIANTALDNGRFTVACGALGLISGCLSNCIDYVRQRQQFGKPLMSHQMIQHKIAEMVTDANSTKMLCYYAANLRDRKCQTAVIHTAIAKNHAAQAANRAAHHAVQIHGARGCHDSLPIERFFRDARILEVIEGTTEILEMLVADHAVKGLEDVLIE